MLRAALKSVLARKLRLVVTALAVVLGVGFTAGTFVLTDTALDSFDKLFGDVFRGTSVVVQARQAYTPSAAGGNPGGGSERNPVPESLLSDVEGVPGVAAADGDVAGFAQVVDPATGKAIQNGGAPTIGNSWDPDVTSLTVVAGSPPAGPDEVAVDAGTAEDHHLSVGERVRVTTTTTADEFTVSGIVRFAASNSLLGATLAIFDLPTAQRLFDREGEFDFVYVKAEPNVTPAQLASRISTVLPKGYQAITGETAAKDQQDQVNEG